MTAVPPDPKPKQGFASMSPERRREIARLGGHSVPNDKRAFSVDRQLAALAGSKGGRVSRANAKRKD